MTLYVCAGPIWSGFSRHRSVKFHPSMQNWSALQLIYQQANMAVAERNPCHRPLLFACLDRSIERLFRMAYLAETIVSPRICLLHSVLPSSESLFLFLTFENDACCNLTQFVAERGLNVSRVETGKDIVSHATQGLSLSHSLCIRSPHLSASGCQRDHALQPHHFV